MNLVIVRMADHTTQWFFDCTAREHLSTRSILVITAPDSLRPKLMVKKFLSREWVSVETRKIDPETWTDEDDAALLVEAWVYQERKIHASSKFGRGSDPRQALIEDTRTGYLDTKSSWYTFITNYLSRAGQLQVNQPPGTQAAGKLVTTTTHMLETIQLVHGTIPAPGDSSAGCLPWDAPVRLRTAREAAGVN